MTEIFLDPTAELSPMARPLLPRLSSLEGKTIGLLDIAKPRGDVFLDRLEVLFVERGVKVTVSTDDPPFFATTMTREFEELNRVFGWDRPDFDALNTTAIEAAFCDDATRAAIVKRLEAAKND